ncbi:MAG: phosphoribosylglycinamide formyltransferase [Bacteroidales bacterium]
MKKRIVLFASGGGTNAENIIRFFQDSEQVDVCSVFCNKKGAGVIDRADHLSVPVRVFSRDEFKNGVITKELQEISPDLIVLAGFLWLIPEDLIKKFPNKIINIHPALLPNYGGKGMYGMKVHEAVVQNQEKYSGISIHYVNQFFDEGEILFQAKTDLEQGETPESLAEKIHMLEYEHFPEVIATLLK